MPGGPVRGGPVPGGGDRIRRRLANLRGVPLCQGFSFEFWWYGNVNHWRGLGLSHVNHCSCHAVLWSSIQGPDYLVW